MALRILVSGKGGVGKTTIAALLSLVFARQGYSVLALDTDSVPNLAQSLGVPPEIAQRIIPLTKNENLIAEKTGARPGESWGVLFSLSPDVSDIVTRFGIKICDNLTLVVVGSIDMAKEGCMCPAIALAKAFLLHVMLKGNEVIVVDSEAGAEVFGRGLAEKFDVNLCVAEPALKALSIAKKLVKLANELGIKHNIVVINKVSDADQATKLFNAVFGDASIPYHIVRYDPLIQELENMGRGLSELPENRPVMSDIKKLMRLLETLAKTK